jgi:hypothetical protein
MVLKSRTLAEKQRIRATGDYSVTVDRSGTSLQHLRRLLEFTLSLKIQETYFLYPHLIFVQPRREMYIALTAFVGGGV